MLLPLLLNNLLSAAGVTDYVIIGPLEALGEQVVFAEPETRITFSEPSVSVTFSDPDED